MEALNFNIEDVLPSRNAAKALRLIETPIALHGALRAVMAEEEDARRRKMNAEQELSSRAEAMRIDGKNRHQDFYDRAVASVAAHDAEAKRRSAVRQDAADRWNEGCRIADNVKDFIVKYRVNRIHGGARALADRPIKPEIVADPLAAIAAIRSKYAAFDTELAALELAPLPIAEVRRRIVSAVDAIATKSDLRVDPRIRAGDPAKLDVALRGDRAASFFVWLLRDHVIARLNELAGDEEAPNALTDANRQKAILGIAAKRLASERAEEAIILGAEQRGISIARRQDADPRAILEVE